MSVDIRRTQLQTGTASYVLINDGSGVISEEQRLAVVRGGTGVNGSSAGNGTLLIGNGSGYTLANITQGSNQGVTITNGSGSIDLETVQDIRTSATPGFTQVTVSNDPSSSGHVVNLSYLNSVFSRLRLRTSCRVATTTALPTNIYSNGTAGVGATLTGSSNGALAAVDGVTLVVGNRLLVKDEAAGEHNGIYEVTTVGDGSNPYVITRVTDTDTTLEFPGASVEITAGSTLSGTQWGCVTVSPTVGTTPLVFVRFYGVGFYTADNSTLELSGMTFNVKTGGITNTHINASAAIDYSKLALTGSIVNADVSNSAAIAYSKLALTGSIVNADVSGSAAIDYSKLALTNSIVNADIGGSAAIAYSKLALTNSIVNADVSSSAAIAYSKLNLTTSILNADINAGAAIAFSKLANVSATQRVLGRNSGGSGAIEEVTATQILDWIGSTRGSILYKGASGWAALTPGTSGYVLTSQGAGADPTYTSVSGSGVPPAGTNTGGIVYNSSSLPPSVLPGLYDVNTTGVDINTTTTLSLSTNAFLYSRQALDASQCYNLVLANDGTPYYILALGAAVSGHTGNITSISYSSGTATLTKSTGTIGTETGNIVVVSGSGTGDGVFLITGGNGSSTITYESTGSTSGAAGTYTIYASAGVTQPPSLVLNPTANGYYFDSSGVNTTSATDYRGLGRWFTNSGPNTTYVVPFGTGAEQGLQYTGSLVSGGTITVGATTTPPTKGTTTVDTYTVQVKGGCAEMWGSYTQTGGSPADGSGTYLLSVPETIGNIASDKIAQNAGGAEGLCGWFSGFSGSGNYFVGNCYVYSTANRTITVLFYITAGSGSNGAVWGTTNLNFNQTPYKFSFYFKVPLVGFY